MMENNNLQNIEDVEETQTFVVQDEFGRNMVAELLTILEIDGVEYAVYSIDVSEEDSDVFVARIVKDAEGNDNIVTIENEEERAKVFGIVQEMINES